MDDMDRTWADTLSEILSFMTYGWSYHEIVYKRRIGRTNSPVTHSKYSDGLIGWRKLPIRSQDTLYGWIYKDDSDDLMAMDQVPPPHFEHCIIPVEKAQHFRTRSRKDNPEGRSILRTAYRAYYFKKRLEEIEGYGMERDLAGFPVLYAPADMPIWDSNDPEMLSALATAENIVSSIRRDAREGLVLPGGENGWKLELVSSGSRRQFDTNQIIDRYDKRIATSVLADFVMLGQQTVGSFALADSKTKIFALAVGTYLDIICEVFNNQAIPRLIDVNGDHFKGITDYPTMVHGDIEDRDLSQFSDYITKMVGAGLLVPDEELEDEIRRVGELPERKETSTPREVQPDENGPQQPSTDPTIPQQQPDNTPPQGNRGSSVQTAQQLAQTVNGLATTVQNLAEGRNGVTTARMNQNSPQSDEKIKMEQEDAEDEKNAQEARKSLGRPWRKQA